MKLEKIVNFEIVRSYDRKIMVKQFEPESYFSSWKAIIKPDATEEELKAISDELSEKAEEDVLSKIDPTKVVSRRQSMAELRTKLKTQEERIAMLEKQLSKQAPF